jgi:hypothetical protein
MGAGCASDGGELGFEGGGVFFFVILSLFNSGQSSVVSGQWSDYSGS